MNFVFNKKALMNKNMIFLGLAGLAIIAAGVLVAGKLGYGGNIPFLKSPLGASAETVAKKSVDFLNANKDTYLNGEAAALEGFSEDHGLVNIKLKIGGNSFNSYATKDGVLLFPSSIELKP